MEKILQMTLKKKWFDMIISGEKKEEYRELKDYWKRRLISSNFAFDCDNMKKIHIHMNACPNGFWKDYTHIIFKNGYSKSAPSFKIELKSIEFGNAIPEWSDNWKGKVFVLKLGEICQDESENQILI